MRESKASSVVLCLHNAGGRKHFRLGVSSSVGHCCQHFWVGWGPNRIKGGLRRGKCQRDKHAQALQIFLGRLQLDDADVVVYKSSKTPRPCCRAVERACFGCARSVALVTSINMAGGACKCGVGSLVHRRKFDRSQSDVAVLCAGVSFSWAKPTQQPNESWVFRRIWLSVPAFRFAVMNQSATRKFVQVALVQASLPTRTNQLHVNPRGSISGYLQSRFTTTNKKIEQMQCHSTSQQVTKVRTHAHMQSLACPHGKNACLTTHHFYLLGIQ